MAQLLSCCHYLERLMKRFELRGARENCVGGASAVNRQPIVPKVASIHHYNVHALFYRDHSATAIGFAS